MLKLFALLLFAASALGQSGHQNPHNPHYQPLITGTCHCNTRGLNEENVVNELVLLLDLNHNQEIVIGEVVISIAKLVQLQLPVADDVILGMNADAMIALAILADSVRISKDDFVTRWVAHFGDCNDFVEAVFDAFDDNRDGFMNIRELEGILFHVRQVTGNLDSHITLQEAHDFFMWGEMLPCGESESRCQRKKCPRDEMSEGYGVLPVIGL